MAENKPEAIKAAAIRSAACEITQWLVEDDLIVASAEDDVVEDIIDMITRNLAGSSVPESSTAPAIPTQPDHYWVPTESGDCARCGFSVGDHPETPKHNFPAAEPAPPLSEAKQCQFCDSTNLAVCSYCFGKPTERARARGEECERLLLERDAARAQASEAVRIVEERISKWEALDSRTCNHESGMLRIHILTELREVLSRLKAQPEKK